MAAPRPISLHPPRRGRELRFALERADLSVDHRAAVDVQPPAVVRHVAADHAAVDDLRAAVHGEVSGDTAEDVHPPAVFDVNVAVHRAAEVELAALDDPDVPADRPPQRVRLVDQDVAADLSPLFPHVPESPLRRAAMTTAKNPDATTRVRRRPRRAGPRPALAAVRGCS